MAYDQGRPYDGRATQPPGPAQQYPPQNYAQGGAAGGYDQYAQGDYGYDNGNGYAQGHDQGQRQPPTNARGRGGQGPPSRGYPPQNQNPNYPPQGAPGYVNDGGRGGPDPRSQGRGGRGGPDPYAQRPPPRGDSRGYAGPGDARPPPPRGDSTGYAGPGNAPQPPRGDSRGYQNDGGAPRPNMGRGGRAAPMERPPNTDPGMKIARKPLIEVISPQGKPRDTAFPEFPGASKSSRDEKLTQNLGALDFNDMDQRNGQRRPPPPQSQASSRSGPPGDGYGPPGGDGGPLARGYPTQGPPQGYNGPPQGQSGPGPGPQQGYERPRENSNGYGQGGYNPGYSANTPASPARGDFDLHFEGGNSGKQYPLQDAPGGSAPYNGSVGRIGPLRPSTASGDREAPQRTYPSQAPPVPQVSAYDDGYGNDGYGQANGQPQGQFPVKGHRQSHDSVSDVYDAYFECRPLSKDYQDDGYGQGQYGQGQYGGQSQGSSQGGYGDPHDQAPMGYAPPARSATAPPARSMTGSVGSIGRVPAPGGLPAHPPPFRPGLQTQNTTPVNNRPPPVRNYAGSVASAETPSNVSRASTASATAPARAPDANEGSVTHEELERLRAALVSNPSDQQTQLIFARKLVLAAELLTPSIPDGKARAKARERWVTEAHKQLKKLASVGNADAMFFLADCYGRGALGLETSPSSAFTLYQSAAKAGHAQAAYRTAVCCEIGQDDGGGTRKDPLKAIQWYKRAATLGDTPAMYKMGMIQLKGLLGQTKNVREAVMWLKRAADRADAENPHALHELALLYDAPQSPDSSVVRDEAYSLSLFRQAADMGYKFSQFRMGCAYEYGLFNLTISPKESIQWYSRAAVQEEHQSELALSGWYLTGAKEERSGQVILAQSDTEAYLWARKAAVAGLAKAEYAMGYFTEMGIGSVRDMEGAKRWYWRAAAQNFPKAREKLEELKRTGGKGGPGQARERISRSKVGKQNEGDCSVM